MKNSLKALMVAGMMMVAGPVMAQQSEDFDVTANVIGNCVIDVTGDLAFGAYDPVEANLTTDKTGSTTISVRCTKGTSPVSVALNGGLNAGSDADGNRTMLGLTDAAETLGYTLRVASATGDLWGDGVTAGLGAENAYTGWVNDSAAVTETVFGVLKAGQGDVSVQEFRDTVTASVNF